MKAIINSLKRTHWFKASVAFLTFLLLIAFPSCQEDEINQDSLPDMDSMSSSALYKINKPEMVRDYDGNWYKTVKIGDQWLMAENLKTTHYNNGELIGTTTPATRNIIDDPNPEYQWTYDGNESNVSTYGRLYTWYTATDSRGLCPTGWHIQTDAEWLVLDNYLGGVESAGGLMKEAGTRHWNRPNVRATNKSKFTGLPGGYRLPSGHFVCLGDFAFFWTSTEGIETQTHAWSYTLVHDEEYCDNGSNEKECGFSIRCIKDY
jgi:uncharacterized protein (TIGR02145 family)